MTTRSPRLLLTLSAGLTLAAASLPFAAAAQDPPADAVCERGWTELELRDDIAPEGVAMSAPDEVWIAGGSLLGGGLRQASVLHGVGDAAELELPPTPATRDTGLMAIAVAGPGEPVWAVGFARETDFVTAYATRRTDAGWELLPTPEPKGFNAALTDVAARGPAVWAAGFVQGQPGDQRPWVLEWRGDHWRGETLPLAAGERATLSSVSISDDGQVWVAGTAIADADGEMVPYLAVRAGEGWTRYQVAGLHDAVVADIDMRDPTAGWAVGHRLSGSTIEPLLLRWAGSDWSVTSGPAVGVAPTLLTSVSTEGGAVIVGGTTWDPGKGRYLPLVVRLAESGSGSISLARPAWGMGAVTDIAGDPAGDGWVVGRTDEGLVARICHSGVKLPQATTGTPLAPAVGEPVTPAAAEALTGPVAVVDVAREAGLPAASQSWGATVADFDGDGRDDLFLGRHGARARLYLNDGGNGFSETGLRFGGGDRHACAAADIDASGLPDLYCAFGASRGTGVKANQLWLDPGGAAPELEPWAGGATEPLGRGRQPRFVDLDEDGDLDLLLGQETKRMDGQPSADRAFLQVAPARFEAAPMPGFDTGLATEDLDVGDYDGDGRDDILLVYWDKRAVQPESGIRLYRNEPGMAVTDVTADAGIESIGERDAALADLDGDGVLDLVQLSEDRLVVSRGSDGRFRRVAEEPVAGGTALATGDADGDGDLDLYVLQAKTGNDGHDLLLRNEGDGRSWQRLDTPTVEGGSADAVVALDYDGDGRVEFLALNGRNSERGPVQLIALRPAD